jgi:hypothetical protein
VGLRNRVAISSAAPTVFSFAMLNPVAATSPVSVRILTEMIPETLMAGQVLSGGVQPLWIRCGFSIRIVCICVKTWVVR